MIAFSVSLCCMMLNDIHFASCMLWDRNRMTYIVFSLEINSAMSHDVSCLCQHEISEKKEIVFT